MKKQSPARYVPAAVLTIGVFLLTYAVVLRFRTVQSEYPADFGAHALWAIRLTPEWILASFYNGSERLWHIFVRLAYALTGNLWTASAIVTAIANAAAYLLLFLTFDRVQPEKLPRWLTAALLAVLFTADALTVPGGRFYRAVGAFNTWHNPTNFMVRPFALAVFYMTVRIYERRGGPDFRFEGGFRRQFRQPVYTGPELVLYPLCVLLSAYAKPSFLQVFAPAIFLFLLMDVIRTRGMLLPFCLKLALAYLPAAVIVLSQFFRFFDGGVSVSSGGGDTAAAASAASGIAVYFVRDAAPGAVLAALGRIALRVLRMSAFPLFVLALSLPRWDAACRLGFWTAAVGRLESVLLHETGSRADDGNFLWGHYLAVWLLWSAAIGRFSRLVRERTAAGKLARWAGLPLLAWHLLSGAGYIAAIFQNGEYFI